MLLGMWPNMSLICSSVAVGLIDTGLTHALGIGPLSGCFCLLPEDASSKTACRLASL